MNVALADRLHDHDLRVALLASLAVQSLGTVRGRVIEELELSEHRVRIDVAVVGPSLSGFEIKSDADTLTRLATQAAGYGRVFDFLWLVTGDTHLATTWCLLPRWWGIIHAGRRRDGTVGLRYLRGAVQNPGVDPFAVSALLWRDELLAALTAHGGLVGLRSKPRKALRHALVGRLEADHVLRLVRDTLRHRTNWREREVRRPSRPPVPRVSRRSPL